MVHLWRKARRQTCLLLVCLTAWLAQHTAAQACQPSISFFPPGAEDMNMPLAWGRTAQMAAGNFAADVMVQYQLNDSAPVVLGEFAEGTPPPKIVLDLEDKEDGYYCLSVSVTILPWTGLLMPGSIAVPTQELSTTRLVCFYKLDGFPRARASFSTCNSEAFAVGIGGISPPPMPLFPGSEEPMLIPVVHFTSELNRIAARLLSFCCNFRGIGGISPPPFCLHSRSRDVEAPLLPAFAVGIGGISPPPMPLYPGSEEPMLFPVVHFTSELNRTDDGHWPPWDVKTSMEHWILAADTSRPYIWAPEYELYEGWYNIHLEVSLTTRFPTLMALSHGSVATYNETKAPEVLKGFYKYLPRRQYPPGTVMGIQHRMSRFRILEGPPELQEIPRHSEVPFSWEFEGFGSTYCFVDGKLSQNYGELECRSPFNVQLHDKRNHTLTVLMKDVCGNNFTVETKFGTWGYALTKVPADPYHELDGTAAAAADLNFDGSKAVFEIAPLQPSTLQGRVSPSSRLRLGGSNSAGTAAGAGGCSWAVRWWVLLLALLVQHLLIGGV
ncbi:hypothetical protein OEZ86_008025 [Tetradesmus obliquus]|nr:hypothetical protein OEZ86_008025 [Tetradesmus obliquus]